jgi:hypothetical protein
MSTDLLAKIQDAVAAVNQAQGDLIAKSKTLGTLLLEAKALHPKVKDFEAYLKRVDGLSLRAPKSERRIIIRSFTASCCDRITERLCELVERSKAARTSNGRELVLARDAAIKAYLKEHNIHIRTCSMGSSSNVDTAAQAAGRAAGDRAAFARPMTGESGVLRIAGG